MLPNTTLFTNSVTVNTAFSIRRMHYEVAIGYQEDIDQVKTIILEAVNSVDGVLKDPPAEALVVALADASVNLCIYWWTTMPQHMHILHQQDKVLTALKKTLIKNGIDLPFPTQQIILQSLPETSHGDHAHQGKALAESKAQG